MAESGDGKNPEMPDSCSHTRASQQVEETDEDEQWDILHVIQVVPKTNGGRKQIVYSIGMQFCSIWVGKNTIFNWRTL